VSAARAGIVLYWATPYHEVWEAAIMSMVIAVMGFAGSMTMSAIKRDRGVRDYGTLVEGHGGVLDRIDAICFAAPVFYLLTRQILEIN
jgi:phosphatidate cytidylyltransferase